MKKKRFLFFTFTLYLLAFIITPYKVYSQKKAKHLAFYQYDNDVFALTDRYYSFGNILGYSQDLDNDFLFIKRKNDERIQLNLLFGQKGYTPDDYENPDVSLYDYTNAGWLFLEAEIFKANATKGFALALEMGLTGPDSFAGWSQENIHQTLNVGLEPLWLEQIPTSFLVNARLKYFSNLATIQDDFYIDSISTGVAGLKDTYIDQEIIFSFGRRLPLHQTGLYNNINSGKEFFGYFGAAYRYVVYNHLLEGSLFNNDAPLTFKIINHVFRMRAGLRFQLGKNRFSAEHNFNTRENERSRVHFFSALRYERLF